MTVSQLREYMMFKVVPEKVMPQNIEALLMDEDDELPELDAFTFLNRLRALGIGSADFIYLLKGCDAPAEVVEKIESNPAMNLNSLILTLEESDLRAQDYTRMLYTARQLWERTMTMRLQQQASAEDESDVKEYTPRPHYAESYPSNAAEYTLPETEDIPEEICYGADEDDFAETEPSEAETEEEIPDLSEETFEETAEEPAEYFPQSAAETSSSETAAESPATVSDDTDFTIEKIIAEIEGINAEDNEPPEDDGSGVSISANVFTETAQFAPLDESSEALGLNITANIITETAQLEKIQYTPREEDDEADEDEKDLHKTALIASAAGAAVLIGASVIISAMGFEHTEAPAVRYAADSAEIFAQIYSAYNDGLVDGAADFIPPAETLFSNLLIEQDGFGTYSDDSHAYVCSANDITLYTFTNGELKPDGTLPAPDGAMFVGFYENEDALLAVFDGDSAGFMRIENGEEKFTASQSGSLCDIDFSDGTISLGTIAVPDFSENFRIEQTERYLPAVCGEVIPAERVLLCESRGCSYALSVRYSAADGTAELLCAALGDAVYASADGSLCALKCAESTMLINALGEQPTCSKQSANLLAAAGKNGISATAEQSETGVDIYIRNNFEPISVLSNVPQGICSLDIEDSTLLAYDESGKMLLAAEISDAQAPSALTPERARGIVRGDYALLKYKTENGILLSLVKRDNTAEALYEYEKPLSPEELASLEFGGAETCVISGSTAGMAYRWFDGVSVVSEFALFGADRRISTLYDDKTGITAAAMLGTKVYAMRGELSDKIN